MRAGRAFVRGVGSGLLAAPRAVEAQQQVGKLSRIGVLMNLYSPDAHPPQALRQRLRDLGYVEGKNLVIDWRLLFGWARRPVAVVAWLVSLKHYHHEPSVTVATTFAL